jgi:hypothetical protein
MLVINWNHDPGVAPEYAKPSTAPPALNLASELFLNILMYSITD